VRTSVPRTSERGHRTLTFETMSTRKSFSLISHDSIDLPSGRTLPTLPSAPHARTHTHSARTGVDELHGVDGVALRGGDLRLDVADGLAGVRVDLRGSARGARRARSGADLEDLLLQGLDRQLHD
jgi:hypothetical protein